MEGLNTFLKKLVSLALCLSLLLVTACNEEASSKISYAEIKILQEQAQFRLVFLDVRTPEEYHSGHIADAINIPLAELDTRLNELDTSLPIVIYCRSGRRSSMAYQILKRNGFKKIYDLGAITNWQEPLQKDD